MVERRLCLEKRYVPPECAACAESIAQHNTQSEPMIVFPITFQSLRIAVEREKENGGHLRPRPDLFAVDEPSIRLKKRRMVAAERIKAKTGWTQVVGQSNALMLGVAAASAPSKIPPVLAMVANLQPRLI